MRKFTCYDLYQKQVYLFKRQYFQFVVKNCFKNEKCTLKLVNWIESMVHSFLIHRLTSILFYQQFQKGTKSPQKVQNLYTKKFPSFGKLKIIKNTNCTSITF